MKIVVNRSFGGFGLSIKATQLLDKLDPTLIRRPVSEYFKNSDILEIKKHLEVWEKYLKSSEGCVTPWNLYIFSEDLEHVLSAYNYKGDEQSFRLNKYLIQVVQELGSKANGEFAKLEIKDIPKDLAFEIHDYDGMETIREIHRSW